MIGRSSHAQQLVVDVAAVCANPLTLPVLLRVASAREVRSLNFRLAGDLSLFYKL